MLLNQIAYGNLTISKTKKLIDANLVVKDVMDVKTIRINALNVQKVSSIGQNVQLAMTVIF